MKFNLRTDDGLLSVRGCATFKDIRRWGRDDFTPREKYEIRTGNLVPSGTAFIEEEEPDAGGGDMQVQ